MPLLYEKRRRMPAMKITLRQVQSSPFPWRLLGAIAAGWLFVYCAVHLASGVGEGTWRFVALSSLYVCFRLLLRR